jgi:hypothetical protein
MIEELAKAIAFYLESFNLALPTAVQGYRQTFRTKEFFTAVVCNRLLGKLGTKRRTPEWLAKQYAGAFTDIRVMVQGADSGTDGERRQKFQEILEYLIRGAKRTGREQDNVMDLPA